MVLVGWRRVYHDDEVSDAAAQAPHVGLFVGFLVTIQGRTFEINKRKYNTEISATPLDV